MNEDGLRDWKKWAKEKDPGAWVSPRATKVEYFYFVRVFQQGTKSC